ncbi:LytR family transcriptional regulator [Streptomyces ipomoeae]|uniref:LytR family transcriptional regulator n=1 Tax=Streptomyces ipomoeae TaxID=103232 RepID=A0A540PRU6_9ACTN|nr:LCP family protein [Streptomyces ipomoeae]MDX2821601.1 LCP family protein [Streptomyces ipomoeae]MDX2875288.1 LCP family protein [Streptomyces ipomoeae]MDX2933687.1 LCP family protein [Streptomyces ipomoeae]TQE25911.1 LytR family transcriptional regulator [Streptomyces ipomoeae]TQE38031.1 LytR family transcriptional regulator [Streptomyces ipomoeae]
MGWSAGACAILVLGVAGVGAWVYKDLDDNITAADIDNKLGGDRPANLSPGSKNILVVGSDSRDGANAKYGKDLDTMQSDTLMVMHVPANREWATVVSFPRDSWVEISACEKGDGGTSSPHRAKINEAFAIGGSGGEVAGAAACTIKTVEANTGLRIDHFMSVDFQGFKGMVNALDGIEVCPEEAIHDEKARLDLEAGCQTVRDEKALGYVRTRYSVGDGSDIGRIGRQQEFMEALAEKAQSKLTDPSALYGFLQSATKSLTTDEDLAGIDPLYDLASELKGIPSERLTFLTVPNYPREADVPTDKANIVWQYPQAADLFTSLAKDKEVDKKRLKAETEDLVYASAVRVQVLNGTGVTGRAAAVAEKLREAGFTVVGTGNAPENTDDTTVTYPSDLAKQAEVLTSRLPDADASQAADATAGVVTLVVGTDLDLDDLP